MLKTYRNCNEFYYPPFTYAILPRKRSVMSHKRSHKLLFLLEGDIRIHIGDREHRLKNKELIIIPQNVNYKIDSITTSYIFVLNVTPPVPIPQVYRFPMQIIREPIHDKPLYVHDSIYRLISNVVIDINNNLTDRYYLDLSCNYLYALLAYYYNPSQLHLLFRRIVNIEDHFRMQIESAFDTKMTVAELAARVGMGKTSFMIKFKEIYGITPALWMRQKRIKHVSDFLSLQEISLKEIVDKLNFSSSSELTRFCKKYLGGTPGEILKRKKEESEESIMMG